MTNFIIAKVYSNLSQVACFVIDLFKTTLACTSKPSWKINVDELSLAYQTSFNLGEDCHGSETFSSTKAKGVALSKIIAFFSLFR